MQAARHAGTRVWVAAVLAAAGSPAQAQCSPQWLRAIGDPGLGGWVRSIVAWDPDGSGPQQEILLAPSTTGGPRIWDGGPWRPWPLEFRPHVEYLTVVGAGDPSGLPGDVYVSDSFEVGRWDRTGQVWRHLPPMNNWIYRIGPYAGAVVAGGEFTTAGNVGVSRIARWDETTQAWDPLGGGVACSEFGPPEPIVRALATYRGELWVGGEFDLAGGPQGIGVLNIARWDGAAWRYPGWGCAWGGVVDMTVYRGELVVGGYFRSAGPIANTGIVRWDGTTLRPLGAGVTGSVFALAVVGQDLYVGGSFGLAGGSAAIRVAKWSGETAEWSALGSGIDGRFVSALTAYRGNLVAGGEFSTAGTLPANSIAEWGCLHCYANCDDSVLTPVLNVSDFLCFMNKFASGSAYANCDGSTTAPTLNVSDFVCFANKYAAGCP